MKPYLYLPLIILSILLTTVLTPTLAHDGLIHAEDVELHNNIEDCWMSFEGYVYNITDYIETHNTQELDITSWCGSDITQDFKTQDGEGKDHKVSTYTLLESYKIGQLEGSTVDTQDTQNSDQEIVDTYAEFEQSLKEDTNETETNSKNPYNFWLPFLGAAIPFFITWRLSKTKLTIKYPILCPKYFNFFWNTVMLISAIPSAGFGIFMILRYSYPDLRDINFDFLYWHVESGVILLTITLGHFLTRWKLFWAPIRRYLPI